MTDTHYTIEFTDTNNRVWDHMGSSDMARYETVHEAGLAIKEVFKYKDITKAVVFEWKKSVLEVMENEDPEEKEVKDKVHRALMSLPIEKRKKVLTSFLECV